MRMAILTVLFILVQVSAELQVSDFSSGIFKGSEPKGFWHVFAGTFDSTGQILLAYSDFNGDKYIDLVTMDNDKSVVSIYVWNPKSSIFIPSILNGQDTAGSNIVNVIPSDFDFDGDMDAMLVLSKNNTYEIRIYSKEKCQDYKCNFKELQLDGNLFGGLDMVEPFLVDPKGSNIPYIVVCKEGQRYLLQTNEGQTYNRANFADMIESSIPSYPVLRKHQAAIVDFNGDCRADLVLLSQNQAGTQQYLQFYEIKTEGKYALAKNISLTMAIDQFTFADLNFDGTNDLISIARESHTPSSPGFIQIHYNKYTNQQLCQRFTGFGFDFSNDSRTQRIILPQSLANTSRLSLGDVNSDGYPDLLTVLNDPEGFSRAYLMINTPCSLEDANCSTFNREFCEGYTNGALRTFKYDELHNPIKDNALPAVSASFTDLVFDGRLDVIVNVVDNSNKNHSLSCIVNNLREDSFFIKALPLTSFSSEQDGLLVNNFGVTFQWKITTLEGYYKNSIISQLSQQTHGALQLPFVSIGLGRTNNYLQDFTVVYSGEGQKQSWSPIIPNSQLIIIPDTKEWSIGIYISSVDKIKEVIIVATVILLLIGILVIYLMRKEAEEDRKNQFAFFHLIR